MDGVNTRDMQIVIQVDQADHLLGQGLSKDFIKIEHLYNVKESPEGPHALVQMEFEDSKVLKKDHEGLRMLEIIEQGKNSAICKVQLLGQLGKLFSKSPHVWWITPTILYPDRFVMTLRGTPKSLRKIRAELSKVIEDYKIRLGPTSHFDSEVPQLLPSRQQIVLDKAIEMAYYERPRGCTQRDIAESLGIKQATVSEHLQSAESNIIHLYKDGQ
ncbi:MAG TPA: hypothetical protein HA356_03315 [Candidatus Poseidoniaceae archaeon]|nr:MAG TPA: hypothetical protein D7H95_03320 [Candidatus Poseidoniales archaeon]HII11087.1 hypothetical protein [Candidatus Poseidoniaceae archaeon]|tara:strand:- start:1507 stop:2151 length:645 start_codon:yes stop_codon:yes gene_type:complete